MKHGMTLDLPLILFMLMCEGSEGPHDARQDYIIQVRAYHFT